VKVSMMKATAFIAMAGLAAAKSDGTGEPVRHYYTYLGDITPAESSVGWGSFQVNRNWYMDGFRIEGQTYQTGVFAHAPSSIVYDLSSRFTEFSGFVGLDDGSAEHETFQAVKSDCQNAKVVASVYVDGKIDGEPMVLQRTKGKFIHPFRVNLVQKQELRLTAQLLNADTSKCANNEGAEVAWVDAKLTEDAEIECRDLGDILPEASSVGWGSYWVNKNWYQSGFVINDIRYTTGVFAHAKSEIKYNLKSLTSGGLRTWSDFSFCVGLDDHYNNKDCKDAGNGVHFNVNYQGSKNWNSNVAFPKGIKRGQAAECAAVKLFDKATGTETDMLTISAYSATNPSGNDMCQEAEWVNARVCMDRTAKDCEISTWSAYGACDRSCGSGVKTRTRSVVKYPQFGGKLCPKLDDISRCNEQPCPVNCITTEWSDFDEVECDRSCGTGHQYRYRVVTRHPAFGGKHCPETKQDRACNTHPCPIDCHYEAVEGTAEGNVGWRNWSPCTRSCGRGVTTRTRNIDPSWTQATSYGGKPCVGLLKQTRWCNTQCCPVDCDLTEFGPYTTCSYTCGTGYRMRKREHKAEPSCGGKSCGVLTQVEECNKRECPIDCEVSEWSSAHACSHSCGQLGTQIRHRSINIYPAYGGTECPHLSETKECGAEPCAIDCLVSTFGQWTTCSRSCGTGEHARRRSIRRPVEHGGKECPHLLEMRKCNKHECPIDCEMGPWSVSDSLWSSQTYLDNHCSEKCGVNGRSTRTRKMIKAHANGGKPCGAHDMIETKSCNSQACPSDCVVSEWSDWSKCSVTCVGKSGNGVQYRIREVVKASHFGGEGCPPLNEHRMCTGMGACPIDCDISEWSDWTVCSATCGKSGYQTRTREIFASAKYGGKSCPKSLEESQPCGVSPCPIDCQLGDWVTGACDATCGTGIKTLTRKVIRAAKYNGIPCGATKKTKPCVSATGKSCPIDCVYSTWGPYSACSSACYAGGKKPTKTRVRSVVVTGKNGGKKCNFSVENLEQVETCNESRPCASDCEMGDWKDWGDCSRSCGHGIQVRTRETKNSGNSEGKACPKTVDARSCNKHACPVDCAMTEWGQWDECTAKCGQGFQYRTRTILGPVVPLNGGKSCGEVQQMQYCNEQACPVDCVHGRWSKFSACTRSCGRGTKKRTRVNTPPKNGGVACESDYELAECNQGQCPVHCEFQDWGVWSACSKTCGVKGNVQTRQRGIKVNPQFGGKPCNKKLQLESRICTTAVACSDSCKLSAWKSGTCIASTDSKGMCGEGVQDWSTTILGFGAACPSELNCKSSATGSTCSIKRACDTGRRCEIDCAVSEWAAVTACSASCGGGKRTLERTVTVAPANGGKGCPELKTVEDCSTHACPIDCQYGEWSDYSACSVSCGPQYPEAGYKNSYGVMTRTRSVTAAKFGGADCLAATEEKKCNMGPCPLNCQVSGWSSWTQCSKSCSTTGAAAGQKTRSRTITRRASFGGNVCPELLETVTCGQVRCPIDCQVEAFGNFGTCSATCGGGSKMRSRKIDVAAQFGGRPCPTGRLNGECNTATGRCTHRVACNQFLCSTASDGPHPGLGLDHAYHTGQDGLDWLPTVAPTNEISWESKDTKDVGTVDSTLAKQIDLTGKPTAFPTAAPTTAPHLQFCMNGKWRVAVGWRGAGYGENFCNLCKCTSRAGKSNLQCQRKECTKVKQGKVCTATTCKFVYSFDAEKEVMRVMHNTGKTVDGFNKEERNGSHHRCAYAVNSKAHINGNTGSATALELKATKSRKSARTCVCLCYSAPSYIQVNQPRLTSDSVTDQTKFGQANQAENDHSAKRDGAEYLKNKETDQHNSGSNINGYYVNKWGVTTTYTKNDLSHPTPMPTKFPTKQPTVEKVEATSKPTPAPTFSPTKQPTSAPTTSPTWNAAARAAAQKRETDFSAEVQANIANIATVPYGATMSAALTKEFTQWNGKTIRSNLVRYNFVQNEILPRLTKDMAKWSLKSKVAYVTYAFNKLQATCGTGATCTAYFCNKIDEDAANLALNGGIKDTAIVPSACASLDGRVAMLFESVIDAAEAQVWNGGVTSTPTQYPTAKPTAPPTTYPTARATSDTFTNSPTGFPTKNPTAFPTAYPTEA